MEPVSRSGDMPASCRGATLVGMRLLLVLLASAGNNPEIVAAGRDADRLARLLISSARGPAVLLGKWSSPVDFGGSRGELVALRLPT